MRRVLIWAGSLLTLLLLLAGIGLWWLNYLPTNYYFPHTYAANDPEGAPLGVVGPWGQSVKGVRCRIRLPTTQFTQTQQTLAALEFQNTTDSYITLTGYGESPWGGNWKLDDGLSMWDEWNGGQRYKYRVTLAPNSITEMHRNLLMVEPIPPGQHILSAATGGNGESMSAGPVGVSVRECDWGPADGGLRLHVGLRWSEPYQVQSGSPMLIQTFIHNPTTGEVSMWGFDAERPRIERHGDLLTVLYSASGPGQRLYPRQCVENEVTVPDGICAVGYCRIQLVLQPPDPGTATTGPPTPSNPLMSNIIGLQFTAPAVPP